MLVNVPASALLTIDSIPRDFRILHNGITVHGLLASFLAFGSNELDFLKPWIQTWPSRRELENSMPLFWSTKFRAMESSPASGASKRNVAHIFPPAIGGRWSALPKKWLARDISSQYNLSLLAKQEKKLREDWDIVSKVFPREKLEIFTYFWLLVNTRSFYYELQHTKSLRARNDRMVLCPFIDYFNHNHQGVS